jgi:hypothetical protein
MVSSFFDKIQVRAVSAGYARFGQEREKLEQKRKTRCAAGGFSEGAELLDFAGAGATG